MPRGRQSPTGRRRAPSRTRIRCRRHGSRVSGGPSPDQVVDAVTTRLEGGGGSHVTVGGQRLGGDETASDEAALERWREPWGDLRVRGQGSTRTLTGRELLLGSSFHLVSENEDGGPSVAAWGAYRHGRLRRRGGPGPAGRRGDDGDRRRGRVGRAAGLSARRFPTAGAKADMRSRRTPGPRPPGGEVESTLNSVYPYAPAAAERESHGLGASPATARAS